MKNERVFLSGAKNPAVKSKSKSFGEIRLGMTLASLFLFTFLFSGCVRLTGNAGYWKKNAETEEYEGKSINLDSDDLIYPNKTKGSITT